MNTELFIQRAKEKHGDVYDYSLVEYVNPKTKVKLKCSLHGVFEQAPYNHMRGQGCGTCGKSKGCKFESIPFEKFVEKAHEVHGDKFTYVKESYKGVSYKTEIICPKHGSFYSIPWNHFKQKHGCNSCGNEHTASLKLLTHEQFIKKATEKHGNKYDYSLTKYTLGKIPITIVCKVHGPFQQTASKHLTGGCRKCADDLHASKKRKTTEEYITKVKKIWGDTYDYSLTEYTGIHNKIRIICKKHGEFSKIAGDHLLQGCQLCKSPKHSLISLTWLNYMKVKDKANIQHNENNNNPGEHRIKNSLYHADGYCKETNTLYEFHGSYWHGDPSKYSSDAINPHTQKTFGELYQNTLKKIEHCRNEGYTVKECWESEWRKGIWAVKILQRKFLRRN